MLNAVKRKITIGSFLIALCSAAYFVSYLTRLNFSASMTEIIRVGVLNKESAGLVGTALFVSYGIGQIISGILGDKISPSLIVFVGLVLASLCNAIMPFLNALPLFVCVWGINGFAQSMLWPPMVKLLTTYLSETRYIKACVTVSCASQLSTVFIYLLVPICITVFDWRVTFWFASALAIIMSAIWFLGLKFVKKSSKTTVNLQNLNNNDNAEKLKAEEKEELSPVSSSLAVPAPRKEVSFRSILIASGLIFILAAIAIQGFIRDGLTSWMPTFFREVFDLSSQMSILLNVLLPVFSIASLYLARFVFVRYFKNELKEAIFFFGIAVVCGAIMALFGTKSTTVALICAAVITSCMHSVNLMLIGYVPNRFAKYGKASTVSGITNAFTYVGSSISSYGFAALSVAFGWTFLIYIWIAFCFLGVVILLLGYRRWLNLIKE